MAAVDKDVNEDEMQVLLVLRFLKNPLARGHTVADLTTPVATGRIQGAIGGQHSTRVPATCQHRGVQFFKKRALERIYTTPFQLQLQIFFQIYF